MGWGGGGQQCLHIPLTRARSVTACNEGDGLIPLLQETHPAPPRIFVHRNELGLGHRVPPGLRAHCSCTQGCSWEPGSSRGHKNHSQAPTGGSLPKHPIRGSCKLRPEFYLRSELLQGLTHPSLPTVWPLSPEGFEAKPWGLWVTHTACHGSAAIQAWTPARKHMHTPSDGGYCRNRKETFTSVSLLFPNK